MNQIGVVTIGRNEGDRLIRCLKSVIAQIPPKWPIVYVDSGSTDGSLEVARLLGVQVVELDMSIPFTMARGRNAGFQALIEQFPDLKYVQFVDGDCELQPGWIDRALQEFEDNDDRLAIVCGRRQERFPNASFYNQLADMEWNTPVGVAPACGGDALIRVDAIREVNGYNPALICGEEPEMCIRLRERGWRIHRIDAPMTLHDAAMMHFSQWWKRSIRGGWAIAEGKAMHGRPPESYMVRENKSGWVWGLIVPSVALLLAWPTSGWSLLLFLAYPVLMLRVYRYRRSRGDRPVHASLYAVFCVVSKLPQAIGQMRYWLNRWRGRPAQLIEYKVSIIEGAEC